MDRRRLLGLAGFEKTLGLPIGLVAADHVIR